MTKDECKVGGNVRLNSGGPIMTIINVLDCAQTNAAGACICCEWYDLTNHLQTSLFVPACLNGGTN